LTDYVYFQQTTEFPVNAPNGAALLAVDIKLQSAWGTVAAKFILLIKTNT
jgi:hypothetical protein